jgi:uncharacterized protein YcfJ
MQTMLKTLLGVAGVVFATLATAQITLYESEGFRGRNFATDKTVWDFERFGFNDRASSVIVDGGSWQVCEDARFEGRCAILRPGSYESLAGMGMNRRISSVRPIDSNVRYENVAPAPLAAAPAYDYRQRSNEQLYEANVTSVRAVVGPPEQRCWVERQQVVEDRGGANIPGAIVGGIIGGVLGHQIGSGRGRDVATAGGAVAGAAVGANVGRGGQTVYDRDVQRCENVSSSARPEYWDVTYNFRGIEHRAQLSAPPGPTITVNENGEPRG